MLAQLVLLLPGGDNEALDILLAGSRKKEQLVGELQKKYGYIKMKAEEEVASWEKSCGNYGCSHESGKHDSHNSHDSHDHDVAQAHSGHKSKHKM